MNSEIFSVLGSGVISGIITTFLVFVAAHYWKRIIVPWYEERVYKDIKIDGEWTTSGDENGQLFEEQAIVKQNAHRIWGSIDYNTGTELIHYEFEGEFRNLILTARYWVKDKQDLDRGTFTLMLRNNGHLLKGFYAWYQNEDHDVISGRYEWTKN